MSLTILSVAYPLAPVGPDAIGGAEQILSRIDQALVKAGHRSLVIACSGSEIAGELIPTGDLPSDLTQQFHAMAQERTRRAIEATLRNNNVDLIHMHGLDFASYLPDTKLPILATLHLPASWYPEDVFKRNGNLLVHCVSAAQREACPPEAKLLADIPNGVPIPDGPLPERDCYALAMGRICPEKGFHLAAEAAARASVPFVLAGKIFDYQSHREYFQNELKPRLNGRAQFIGPAQGESKRRLLARARCVLVPSLVSETCSLVALEAMAAGTPVIAFPSGALADVVQDGETGFLVSDVEQMAEAISRVGDISPEACRNYAARYFSADRMTSRYVELYRSLAGVRSSVHHEPVQTELIRDRASFAALVPEWRTLFEKASNATPFQSPDWIVPWWDSFGIGENTGDRLLTIITVRHQGELVGVAPLYIMGRTVRFVGVSLSDYSDVLAGPGWEQTVANSVMDVLSTLEAEWDLCDLDELPDTSPLPLARIPARYTVSLTDASVCPQIPLSGFDLQPKQRRSVSNSRHRLERAFPDARVERFAAGQVDEFIEAFVCLHQARWRERSERGLLASDAVQKFHRAAIPRMENAGVARLYVLRAKDQILSALYCLVHGHTLYYYLGGFDPALERMGPGSLLIDHAIQEARREELDTVDFLRGAEAYKYNWGAVDRRNRRLTIRNCRAQPQPPQ